jgi:hypothetical protein
MKKTGCQIKGAGRRCAKDSLPGHIFRGWGFREGIIEDDRIIHLNAFPLLLYRIDILPNSLALSSQ